MRPRRQGDRNGRWPTSQRLFTSTMDYGRQIAGRHRHLAGNGALCNTRIGRLRARDRACLDFLRRSPASRMVSSLCFRPPRASLVFLRQFSARPTSRSPAAGECRPRLNPARDARCQVQRVVGHRVSQHASRPLEERLHSEEEGSGRLLSERIRALPDVARNSKPGTS